MEQAGDILPILNVANYLEHSVETLSSSYDKKVTFIFLQDITLAQSSGPVWPAVQLP